jgi:hypothetical protein
MYEQGGKMQVGDRVRFVGTAFVGEGGWISAITDDHALVEVHPTVHALDLILDAGKRIMTVEVPLKALHLDPQ